MHARYTLYLSFVIYLNFLTNCVLLEDPNKSKDKTVDETPDLDLPSKEKDSVSNVNVVVIKKEITKNSNDEILKQNLDEEVSKLIKSYIEASESSSQVYKPTYKNKEDSKSLNEYDALVKDKDALIKIYWEILQKEILENAYQLGKVKETVKERVKEKVKEMLIESKEFPGTAEETTLLEEMLEEEYEEYLLTVNDLIGEKPGSQQEGKDTNPNPSFSDINAREILYSNIQKTMLKPPENSKDTKISSDKTEGSDQEKPKKEPELTEEEKQGSYILYFFSCMINILMIIFFNILIF